VSPLESRLRSISRLQPPGRRKVNGIVTSNDDEDGQRAFGGSETVQRNRDRMRKYQRDKRDEKRARRAATPLEDFERQRLEARRAAK
jgi:hypothetical protein